MKQLWQIDAPHFNAGIEIFKDVVFSAAPILDWAIGQKWKKVKGYFVRKGYTITLVREYE